MEEENPVFSLDKVNEAIKEVAGVFSGLEMTVLEVMHALKSLEGGLEMTLGPDRYAECMIYYESIVHAGSDELDSDDFERDFDAGETD